WRVRALVDAGRAAEAAGCERAMLDARVERGIRHALFDSLVNPFVRPEVTPAGVLSMAGLALRAFAPQDPRVLAFAARTADLVMPLIDSYVRARLTAEERERSDDERDADARIDALLEQRGPGHRAYPEELVQQMHAALGRVLAEADGLSERAVTADDG